MTRRLFTGAALALALAACGSSSDDFDASTQLGPHPQLPEPHESLIPTTRIAKVVGWQGNETPTVPAGLKAVPFATGLSSPRNLIGLPNGDVLVVESKKESPEPTDRPKGPVTALIMAQSHGDSAGPSNRVTLLRNADGDGRAEQRSVLIDHLNAPFGIVYANNALYVANTDSIVKYAFTPGQARIDQPGQMLTRLPAGPINHHWTKSLTISPDGATLYVGIGSNSNAMERGEEPERDRAAIMEVDASNGRSRLFASGLRNPNGLTFYPGSNILWAVVNERDELGPNLVPDYLTSVRPGGFYGWPYSYWGQHVDPRVRPQKPELVAQAIEPDYGLGSHVAPLGMVFVGAGGALPAMFAGGAFVGEHGSWNRDEYHGYKVVFIPFANGRPSGKPQDVVTGFLNDNGEARGRPVGLALDRAGALLIADDAGNTVWRVSAG